MVPPEPWAKPIPVADCKECGHRHGARCQHVFGKEADEAHVCGCEGVLAKKKIPVPYPGRVYLR